MTASLLFVFFLTVAGNTNLRLIESDARHLVLEFNPESVFIAPDRNAVTVPGTVPVVKPGEPDLPGLRILLGCPQTGAIRLSTTIENLQEFSDVTVPPAPALDEKQTATSAVFTQDRFFPENWAEIETVETIRNIRVARLRLNPLRFNPIRKKLRTARLRVIINFTEPPKDNYAPDPLDSLLSTTLINGSQAINWKLPLAPDSINFFTRFSQWYQVRTETTGIYRLTYTQLRNAGIEPAAIDPRTIHLFTLGPHPLNGPYPDTMIELPILVPGETDGRFDPQDYILFFAQSPSWWNDSLTRWRENYYTRYQTFWLTWGGDNGRRMEAIAVGAEAPVNRARTRVRLEQDLLCPARGGLLWLWERYTTAGEPYHCQLILPGRDTIKSLAVRFYGKSEQPTAYRALIRLNGELLDTVAIIAQSRGCPPNTFVFESLPGPAAASSRTIDTLTVELLSAGDVYLDYIEVDYLTRLELSAQNPELTFYTTAPVQLSIAGVDPATMILDITDPWQPRCFTGITGNTASLLLTASINRIFAARATAFRAPQLQRRNPGNLRHPQETADYYIITPDEFLAPARLLADYRSGKIPGIANGRARAVALSQIYDDYAFGMEEPGAIKAFLRAKRPAYGLLLGDATYDYKDNLKLNPPPGVPAYEIGFDLDYEVYNEYVRALDAWYADFDGEGSGPDMILARFTARTPQQVRQFLEKLRRYETQQPDLWTRRFLLLADDEFLGDVSKPESFAHLYNCENIAALIGERLDIEKLYLTEYKLEGPNSKPRAGAELIRLLNQGTLLWCYFGHGAGFQLAHERVFHIDDVPRVRNATRLPVAFFGSCGVGRFEDTRYESIAEELVRSGEGCIATMGASKATYSGGNEGFARIFFSKLLENPAQPIGAAFYPAWLTYNLYILFGDPTLRIHLPAATGTIAVNPETLNPGAVVSWSTASEMSGWFALRATEAWRHRFYRSTVGSASYDLPAGEVFRLTGRFRDSITGTFIVPRLDFPDTVVVDNGWYARLRNTCRLTGLVWNDTTLRALISDSLYLSPDPVQIADSQPPEILLSADNNLLRPGDTTRVPRRFRLSGRLTDPAGLLLIPNLEKSLSLFINDRTRRVELADLFRYDDQRGNSGTFSLPVELDQPLDSLVLTATDNCLNTRTAVYFLKTDLREELRLDSCLVYPNPVARRAYFTFILSRPATVTVKIYTIAGRLVRILGPVECPFGYNQIEWDGLDRDGSPLANGIYLYKIDARAGDLSGATLQIRSTTYRDKFIVRN
ncbi:MAG: C25 family cysteine peptidase [candidate division WOR-3 bacterium]